MRKQAEMAPEHERLMMADLENMRELSAALRAATPDVARLSILLRRRDALRAERAALRTTALVQMLEAVSPADRKILLSLYALAPTVEGELPRPQVTRPGQPQ